MRTASWLAAALLAVAVAGERLLPAAQAEEVNTRGNAAAGQALPVAAELRPLVREVAKRHGGRAQVAVTRGGRVAAASSSGPTTRPFRMWSVGKVATAVALLERGGKLPRDVDASVTSALVGSSNCAQRQLMVELQRRAGSVAAARRALLAVLRRAGVRRAVVSSYTAAGGSACRRYLAGVSTPDPFRPALQAGIAMWTLADAARFAFALGDGTLPARVTSLLQRPKRHSADDGVGGSDVTGDLGWGAGVAFGDLKPAYKAGWGGIGGPLIYEQVIHVRGYGIAVTFEPGTQPAHDDPYRTRTPQALAELLHGVRAMLGLR